MKTNILILGAGGHAKVLLDALQHNADVAILGMLDPNTLLHDTTILGVSVLGDDSVLAHYPPASVQLVNGVGSTDVTTIRKTIFLRWKAQSYTFYTVRHPQTTIAPSVKLGEGSQVMAGSVIQAASHIGCNTIINTQASVDHDCNIADHVHIGPGAVLSGTVSVGEEAHIGARSVILQGLTIGMKSLVGAGAVVIRPVPSGSRVVGVPAKEIANIREENVDEALE